MRGTHLHPLVPLVFGAVVAGGAAAAAAAAVFCICWSRLGGLLRT